MSKKMCMMPSCIVKAYFITSCKHILKNMALLCLYPVWKHACKYGVNVSPNNVYIYSKHCLNKSSNIL